MSDSDLLALYSQRILALTAAIPHLGRLDPPCATGTRRSAQCGSTVTVDLTVADGRITRFAQTVRACALGQASAAVLGGGVLGAAPADLRAARDAVGAMLNAGGPPPPAPFAAIEALTAARTFPNRHASILLAWDATVAALDAAGA